MGEILLILYTSPYHIYETILIGQRIPERREPKEVSEDRERKPIIKVPLTTRV